MLYSQPQIQYMVAQLVTAKMFTAIEVSYNQTQDKELLLLHFYIRIFVGIGGCLVVCLLQKYVY